jgi:DNA polymerase
MSKLFIDTETFSPVPIKAGVHRYAEKVEVMLFAWALDDGPVQVWDVTRDVSPAAELWDALFDDATEVWAHNSHFDRTVLRHALRDLCPPLHRWRDTMVQAYAHSLPGSLDMLCQVLGVAQDKAKDKEGKALVRMFCMPDAKGQRNTRETHPEQWAKFITYAGQDIVAMRECHRIMPKWNYPNNADEVALWHLDQRINDRGVAIDTDLAEAAVRAVNLAQAKLAQQTVDMTGGQVQTATQRDAMLAHILEAYGVALPNLQASTLERRIADPDLPEPLRELLAVRLQASTTSTSKYQTLIRSTSSDGRLRGLLQFNGAARTGRWAGRLFQPQNLPRPTMKDAAIELGIEALKADAADLVFDNVMALTSNTIRGCIIAPPGKKLVVADLSNIEGRDQAWLAGEQWKLQAFCDFDAGTGHDLYALAYAKSFGVTPEEVMANKKTGDGSMRQIGKVQELALGYEGGVGAFVTFAAVYGIDLEDLPTKVLPAADDELVAEARDFLGWLADQKGQTFGLSDDAFVACDVLKRAWRRAHPAIASMWRDLRDAAVNAIESPGKTFQVRALKLRRDANWLCIVLPSGRALCYPSPRVDEVNGKDTVTYMGIDQYTRKWSRLKTYGGKLFENICQAAARDVMGGNMPDIEAAGYEIVLTVHDEVLTETPDTDEHTVDHLASLLAATPAWAPDMPLAAAGFETTRYRKD